MKMGLPKNYHQTVNLNKRIEALNDLKFFNFTYEVRLTNKIINEIYDNNKSFEDLEQFLGEINFMGNKIATCKNRISALDSEKGHQKINEWLNKVIDAEIIESYTIKDIEERTFNEEIEDKNLTDILNYKGTN
jgi:hypothetical protein